MYILIYCAIHQQPHEISLPKRDKDDEEEILK